MENLTEVPVGRFELPADRRVSLSSANLDGVDFSGCQFEHFIADGSRLAACDFSRTTFEGGSFSGIQRSIFDRCTFDGADLRHVDPGQARFIGCFFRDVRLDLWLADRAEFVDCVFAGRLREVVFFGRPHHPSRLNPPRERNEFRGNDFREAELIDCSFKHGIDLAAQRLPGEPEYVVLDRWSERMNRFRAAVDTWPAGPEREAAEQFLFVYHEYAPQEQEEMFLRRADLVDHGFGDALNHVSTILDE